LFKKNKLITQKTAVKIVSGSAFFKNLIKPLLKSKLSISNIKVIVCLKECKKQKYKVNATKGER
jgi:hypothetical protein